MGLYAVCVSHVCACMHPPQLYSYYLGTSMYERTRVGPRTHVHTYMHVTHTGCDAAAGLPPPGLRTRRSDRRTVEYCDVLSAMVECNTAVYHLGAGTNAKAASMYFSKYQAKPQYDINCDMLVVICTANEDIRRNPSQADDSGTASRMSKHLTQHIINTGAERSATEAAMICLQPYVTTRFQLALARLSISTSSS
eukprot:COSAG01_NODE_567_length_15336_cov_341.292689_3_plen_195_part_00